MEILKSAVLLANEHRYVIVQAKTTLSMEMPGNVASMRILTRMAASVFHRI